MNRIKNIIFYLKTLYFLIPMKLRIVGAGVLLASFINSLFQLFGISALMPLISAMITPDSFLENKYVLFFSDLFHLQGYRSVFCALCIGIGTLYLVKNLFFTFYSYSNYKYSCMMEKYISCKVLSSYLYGSYDLSLNNNSSQMMQDVKYDTENVYHLIAWLFNIITETLTIVLLILYLILADFNMAMCILGIALVCLFVLYKAFYSITKRNGELARNRNVKNRKDLLETANGMKEIQVNGRQNFFLERYRRSLCEYQKPAAALNIMAVLPTYAIETIFVLGILFFLSIQVSDGGIDESSVPILATFMFGAVRLLPSMGRITNTFNNIVSVLPSLKSVCANINNVSCNTFQNQNKEAEFSRELALKNISFRYQDANKDIIHNLSLKIHKGESIGIIGHSGAGKTTLVDIILGLHMPYTGSLELDDENVYLDFDAYRKIIGYVPQDIYLIDGTIKENIAFGITPEEIDDELIRKTINQAQLTDYIASLEKGIDSLVGERGVKISGGQRQRIAIARALYKEPQIMVLDEATSALDTETENSLMEEVDALYGKVTLIIIAHRLSTVSKCDRIFEIRDGIAIERSKEDILCNNA